MGVESGTEPTAVPTTSASLTNVIGAEPPSPRTAAAASVTSASPANGRRRSVARASARRAASMTWAGEAGYPPARSTAAASQNQRATTSGPACANRWWYQPGARTPAPYPVAAASRRLVHGTQVMATFTFGTFPSTAASLGRAGRVVVGERGDVPRTAHHSEPLEPLLFRGAEATAHVGFAPGLTAGRRGPALAHGGHGFCYRVEHVVAPRCSTRSSHHRSASSNPAAAASAPSGSTASPASSPPARAGGPASA